jgi:DNA-binding Lrp family transcriptional regulator
MPQRKRTTSRNIERVITRALEHAGGSAPLAEIAARACPKDPTTAYHAVQRMLKAGTVRRTGSKGKYFIAVAGAHDRVAAAARLAKKNGVSRSHTTLAPLDELVRVIEEISRAERIIEDLRTRRDALVREIEDRLE